MALEVNASVSATKVPGYRMNFCLYIYTCGFRFSIMFVYRLLNMARLVRQ